MNHKTRAFPLLLSTLPFSALAAESGFIEDSTATLQLRNYYFSRDFSESSGRTSSPRQRNGPRDSKARTGNATWTSAT